MGDCLEPIDTLVCITPFTRPFVQPQLDQRDCATVYADKHTHFGDTRVDNCPGFFLY